MNTIKKRLDKLPRNKIYKICQKMKVKCETKTTKKEMISKLLRPLLHKYRMNSSDIDFSVLKIGGNKYVNKHLNNLKGTPQITIGLPLRDLPRLFEERYMSEVIEIGQRTGTKYMFKSLYENMKQLEDMGYTIAQHKGTEAYGLVVLVNSYINMFMYKHEFDDNTGMKGLPLFMSRNSFSDLYDGMDATSQLLFEVFVEEAREKIPELVLYVYLDPDVKCGKQFPLLVTDWLQSIIFPNFTKRDQIINNFMKTKKEICPKGWYPVDDNQFRKKDLMSPPIPYISWVGHYDQRYSMGALNTEGYQDLMVILECRECIGGAGPTTLNTFEKYGIEFIEWYTQFAEDNKFGFELSDYTIGFEYELAKGKKQKDSIFEYTRAWDYSYKNDKGEQRYKKFPLGSTGEMHFDFADKPGMVHEYVSKPFNLKNGEFTFKKFVDDIFNYDKDKAIQYFDTKERLKKLTLDQLQTLCSHDKMETKIKNKDGSMKTKNKIISDILKIEWEELDEKTLQERIK